MAAGATQPAFFRRCYNYLVCHRLFGNEVPMADHMDTAGSIAGLEAKTLDTLKQLDLAAGHWAVCGLQWGDEGKGQIVDLLTQSFDLVVRYNGGNNAGHSVQIGDQKFALHLIPSGILCPNTLNVVANGVVVDPPGILEEIDGLTQRGIDIGDNLRISSRAHVVLPYHKIQDSLFDSSLAKAWESPPLGTTGRGIGPCYADKALRSTAIRMNDLLKASELKPMLARIVAVKNTMLGALAKSCGQPFEPLDAGALYEACGKHADRLHRYVCDTAHLLNSSNEAGKKILFEGANAALLDIDHGTYPFVTSSSCSSLGIYPGTGMPGGTVKNVMGIVKLYSSRVGSGPFPTELHDQLGQQIREVGKEYGTTTNRPRRCGWLDLAAVKYTTIVSGATALACTGLSVLAGIERLKVCTGYRVAGQILDGFPADADVLNSVEPIFEELAGFDQPVATCTSYKQLPSQARDYLDFTEEYLTIPIRVVCVGQRRDQIIVKDA